LKKIILTIAVGEETDMAVASLVCGIIGLVGFLFFNITIFRLQQISSNLGNDFFISLSQNLIQMLIKNFSGYLFIPLVLLILALIFGKVERTKGKTYKYYGMATAGLILGLIGVISVTFVLFTGLLLIIFMLIYARFIMNWLPESIVAWGFPIIFFVSLATSIIGNIIFIQKITKQKDNKEGSAE
jgi:MFS family permease